MHRAARSCTAQSHCFTLVRALLQQSRPEALSSDGQEASSAGYWMHLLNDPTVEAFLDMHLSDDENDRVRAVDVSSCFVWRLNAGGVVCSCDGVNHCAAGPARC